MGSPFTLVERIRMERSVGGPSQVALLVFYVQHPSNEPKHGSGPLLPPTIHEERIVCEGDNLNPLGLYLQDLIRKAPK